MSGSAQKTEHPGLLYPDDVILIIDCLAISLSPLKMENTQILQNKGERGRSIFLDSHQTSYVDIFLLKL